MLTGGCDTGGVLEAGSGTGEAEGVEEGEVEEPDAQQETPVVAPVPA
jgi:hypothetical protein